MKDAMMRNDKRNDSDPFGPDVFRDIAVNSASAVIDQPHISMSAESALSELTIAWGERLNYHEWSMYNGQTYVPLATWNQIGQITRATPVSGTIQPDWGSGNGPLESLGNSTVEESVRLLAMRESRPWRDSEPRLAAANVSTWRAAA